MERQSEHAVDLANRLASECWYPRMADLVSKTIQNCVDNLTPLSDEQQQQLYRASFEAGDGVAMDLAHVIDQDSARSLITSVMPASPLRRRMHLPDAADFGAGEGE